jgi:hypothetical protein
MAKKKSLEDVHKFIEEEDYESAVTVLRKGMAATHIVRKSKEDGERGVDYTAVPDHGTRLQSAKLMLEYGFGKPATRHDIKVTDNTTLRATPAEIMARLQHSGQDLANIVDVYTRSVEDAELLEPIELENGKKPL